MENSDIVGLAVSIASLSVAIAAFVVARRDPRPNISGWINAVLHAPLETPDGLLVTAVMLNVTLTNSRPNPAHIVSYDLAIDRRGEWEPLGRVKDVRGFPPLTTGDRRILLSQDVLIYWPPAPIEYGQALTGIVVFFIKEPAVSPLPSGRYRLTVTDVFGRKYDVPYRSPTPGGFDEAELFAMAGAKIEYTPEDRSQRIEGDTNASSYSAEDARSAATRHE